MSQDLITSTVLGNTPTTDIVKSDVDSAASDSVILTSEFEDSISEIVDYLTSDSASESEIQRRVDSAEPVLSDFTSKLQESIFNAKASTPQGLILNDQLSTGQITQEQFESSVNSIPFTEVQAIEAASVNLYLYTQKLIVDIVNDDKFKTQTLSTSDKSNTPKAQEVNESELENKEYETSSSQKTNESTKSNTTRSDGIIYYPVNDSKVAAPQEINESDKNKDYSGNWFEQAKRAAIEAAKRNSKASIDAFWSLRPFPKIISGARAVVKINNNVAALCVNVNYEVTSSWEEIRGVDEMIPNELVPMSYSVKGSMTLYRVPNESPIKSYLAQDVFRGIIWPYSKIEIRDKRTDELLMLVNKAAITSRSESFEAGKLTATTLTFMGTTFRDEVIPEVLPPDNLKGGSLDLIDRLKKNFFG